MLTAEQVEHFLDKGFVVIRGCFSRAAAAEFTAPLWDRLGYAEHDPSTWAEPIIHMPYRRQLDVREFAPKAWAAACDLVGGAERISADRPYVWNDSFIVNLRKDADRPWQAASAESPGWHKDGDFFRHFLDSPEQGLLTIVLWSNVRHQGGATFVAADSVGPVARLLADNPQGVYPLRPAEGGDPDAVLLPYDDLIAQCHDFVEATGEVGDVYLLHPFVLHAKSPNVLKIPRLITNPPLTLAEPLRFDRADPDLSPVERAVLRALGTTCYEFSPTGPREAIVPPRIAEQRRLLAEEQRRLRAT
ncbi:MAG TPA: hypothetical protein VGR06_11780 [Actinophytocola sp.]|uniref:hypothetical protein n=1 Tax=Actinophytocola sp. TaxID=1872138 RepID=UPI002E0CBD60|nr:hypothetical protein [Actinophytocola sp.]